MATIVFKDIADEIELMPIRAFQIQVATGATSGDPDLFLNFYQLETESNFTVVPIVKVTSDGITRRFGFNVNAAIYLPLNKLESNDLLNQIDDIKGLDNQINIALGTDDVSRDQAYTEPDVINATHGMTIRQNNVDVTAEVEYVQFRPRTILRAQFYRQTIQTLFL